MYTYFLTKKRAEKHQLDLLEMGIVSEIIKSPGKWAVYHEAELPEDVLADGYFVEKPVPIEDDADQIRDEYIAEVRKANRGSL